MPPEEREICRRLREFRLKTELSQVQFAILAGINPRAYAGFEYGRNQLNYHAASKIFGRFEVLNPVWLADGSGDMVEARFFKFPTPDQLKAGKRSLFSNVFARSVRKDFLNARVMRLHGEWFPVRLFRFDASASGRLYNNLVLSDAISEWLVELPASQVKRFLTDLYFRGAQIFARYPRELDSRLVDDLKKQMFEIKTRQRFSSENEIGEDLELTNTTISDKSDGVKSKWFKLKKKIQAATADAGAKSKLANFLRVDLTQLSKWLTDSDSAREPGADYTLRMLSWVNDPKRQKLNARRQL